MGKRNKDQDQQPVDETAVDNYCRTATMIWCPGGVIAVVGGKDSIVSFFKTYEEAVVEFYKTCRDIEKNERYTFPTEVVAASISTFMDTNKKSFLCLAKVDKKRVIEFLKTSQVAVQFLRVGANAFVLHNMENFHFLTSTSEIETLVPELFLSPPKVMNDLVAHLEENDPEMGGRFVDPEIQRMLDRMKTEQPYP